MGSSPLPPLADRWITELTGSALTGEPQATCLDCVMLAPEPGALGFHPETKCCTYTPALPNYLVGAALADPRLDEVNGRSSIRARITGRAGVTPIGLLPAPVPGLLTREGKDAFGLAPELRCPHYHGESGKCGIWLHRNAVCSTWFCKHERGAAGLAYFRALRDLLAEVERQLARHCVLELDAPYVVVTEDAARGAGARLSASDLAGTVDDAEYRRRWGRWAGREEELFARAGAIVAELTWSEVLRICGPEVGLRVRAFRHTERLRDEGIVPASLLLRKVQVVRHEDSSAVLKTYCPTDPIAIPQELLRLLPMFRGQPTPAALAEIAEMTGIELDDELIIRLVDYEILEAVGAESPGD